jgi:hypothetical protein
VISRICPVSHREFMRITASLSFASTSFPSIYTVPRWYHERCACKSVRVWNTAYIYLLHVCLCGHWHWVLVFSVDQHGCVPPKGSHQRHVPTTCSHQNGLAIVIPAGADASQVNPCRISPRWGS